MMLRMVCPKCHHHFPVLGCCLKWNDETNQKEMKEGEEKEKKKQEKEKEKHEEEKKEKEEKEKEEGEEEEEDEEDEEEEEEEEQEEEEDKREEKMAANTICSTRATYYVSSLPVSHGCTSDSSCFINPSTKIQEPTIFQSRTVNCGSNVAITDSDTLELFYDIRTSMKQNHHPLLTSPIYQSNNQDSFITENLNYEMAPSEQYAASTCELTGGSVTIATPDIQSGGCLIQHTEPEILVQASQIKIEPKLTGGGCLVQKKLTVEDERLATSKCTKNFAAVNNRTFVTSPNGYSELPANIRVISSGMIRDNENNEITSAESRPQKIPNTIKTNNCCDCKSTFQQNHCQYHHRRIFDASLADNRDSLLLEPISSSVQFRVNATVQLPANLVAQCTVNITATTTTPSNQVVAMKLPGRGRNNFHGGGLVQPNELDCAMVNQIVAENNKSCNNTEQVDETLTTPVSWPLTAWSPDVHVNRLREVKRLLQICGWYHEGISRQQSENLLKDASVGRWLMRDSSDYRFTFAVSVKTTKGPASIRVHYFLEHFRLETTDPKLALAMPFFDCPIKMLEYYVAYSKRMDEHRREVWVDYSGQLYSQIYLTSPLVKEVRSLSHLARLAVNRNKLPIDCLPLLIKNYIKEYPYTL